MPEVRDIRLDLVVAGSNQVVGHEGAAVLQPPRGDLRKHGALIGNRLFHHDVERADPVGRHDQQPILAHIVDVAHLAAPYQRKGKRGLGDGRTH
jgi:hypothetical protein